MNQKTEHSIFPKLSIIVPVYNVEKYLPRCLDSIVAQTFNKWECIMIDDGSQDNSGAICDEYASRDKRFRVIHQDNKGVSSARNVGMDAALGDWIGFVDSDDWIETETYEIAITYAQKSGADVVRWYWRTTDESESQAENFVIEEKELKISHSKPLHWSFNAMVLGIYKHSLIDSQKQRIRCDEKIFIHEDMLFVYEVLLHSQKIILLDRKFYTYNIHSDSAIHDVTYKKIENHVQAVEKLERLIKNNKRDYDFYATLKEQKKCAKDKFVFLLSSPDFNSFRKTFPELNLPLLFSRGKRKILYFFIFFHIDFIANFIISKCYKKNAAISDVGSEK